MTINNEKMSAEEMALAMMLKAGFVNPDTLNPQEEDLKAFSQHLQEREDERRGLQVGVSSPLQSHA